MKTTTIKSQFGTVEENCTISTGWYTYGKMRYIQIFTQGESYDIITVNMPELVGDPRYNPETDVAIAAHHDENYVLWVMENLDGEILFILPSGFVAIPVMRINVEKLKEFTGNIGIEHFASTSLKPMRADSRRKKER